MSARVRLAALRVVAGVVALMGAFATSAPVAAQGILRSDGTPDPNHADLWAWFDASSGVNSNSSPLPGGTSLFRWDDRGAGGRDLIRVDADPGARPTVVADPAAGGGRAVRFDGNDYVWAAQSDIGRLSAERTLFVVCRVRSADGGYVVDGTTSSGRTTLHTGEQARPGRWHVFVGDGSGGSLMQVGPAVATDANLVHSVVLRSGAQQHRIAGRQVAADTLPSIGALGGLLLGARFNLANRFDGEIREVLVYRRALSAQEVAGVESYLFDRHGRDVPVPPPTPVDVFVNNDGLYPNYRIPAILRTEPSGTLLAFAEGRQGGDQSENDMVLRRSLDGGASWGPVQLIHDDGRNALNNPTVGQIRTGPHAGRVLLMYQRYPLGTTIWNAPPGHGGAAIVSVWLTWSDDEGASWAVPTEITSQVKPPSVARSVNSGPGRLIQLRHGPFAGRIVVPFNRYDTDGTWGNYAAFSDDGGVTWQRGQDVPRNPALIQGNECQVVERADGSVLLNSRRSVGAAHRKVSISYDGAVTWSPLRDDLALPDPACMASVLRFTDPADGLRSRILFAGPDSTGSRVQGSVWISHDEGGRWSAPRVIAPGGYAYSCLTRVDERRFGVLYEANGTGATRFVATTVEWVSGGSDCLGNGLHGAVYGTGCAGALGRVPGLGVDGCPTPGQSPELVVSQALPGAVGALNLGLATAAVTVPPCTLLVGSPVVAVPLTVDGQGEARTSLPLPGDIGSIDLYAQALILDPAAVLGVATSVGRSVLVF